VRQVPRGIHLHEYFQLMSHGNAQDCIGRNDQQRRRPWRQMGRAHVAREGNISHVPGFIGDPIEGSSRYRLRSKQLADPKNSRAKDGTDRVTREMVR